MRVRGIVAVTILLAACGGPAVPADSVDPLPTVTPQDLEAELAATTRGVVVNVWASWCAPCRSEAPLLRAAASEWGDRVAFIGIDVRDSQEGAQGFIAEFGLTAVDHRFDPSGAVPRHLGGVGVPLTFFFHAGGELAHAHRGVIDERTLAFWLDVVGGNG